MLPKQQGSLEISRRVPLAYLITFTCYGTRLAGNESGSVDREHNLPGSDFLPSNPRRLQANTKQLGFPAYEFGIPLATIVLRAIREVCEYRGWKLLAVHVRARHVHLVAAARERPEKVMGDVKAYASRTLNRRERKTAPRWTRHGSTRYLWKPEEVCAAVQYVVHEQGEPMAVWENPEGLACLGSP